MDDLSTAFEELRPQLFRVAYGILGSIAEAEEVVQEAWLRLDRAEGEIESPGAWLKTVVSRLALDALASARTRRETYVGEWLPEPLVGYDEDRSPESQIALDESVAGALQVVLERLSAPERISFLLHDTFGMPFAEIAELVGRTPEGVRQLAARARRNIAAAKPRFPVDRDEQKRLVLAFAMATSSGDLEQLLELLDPSVVFRSDGGGRVTAARLPIEGAPRVGRALIALTVHEMDQEGQATEGRFAWVNGAPGMIIRSSSALTVMSFAFAGGRIVAVNAVRNPEKLGHVRLG
jgi:RNA polymerase sigma-70 factor (ECF subfamily)